MNVIKFREGGATGEIISNQAYYCKHCQNQPSGEAGRSGFLGIIIVPSDLAKKAVGVSL